MNEYGYKIAMGDIPGNMFVVLVQATRDQLVNCQAFEPGEPINDNSQGWLVLAPHQAGLAQDLSEELGCKCIEWGFYDATMHLSYTLYENGEKTEQYSFGPNESEAGIDFAGSGEARPNETLIRDGADEFRYFSKSPHPEESQLKGGEAFLNQLFVEQKALLGWQSLPD